MDSSSLEISADKLKAARGERRPVDVASYAGITYAQLWNIESGKSKPSSTVLARLCSLYQIDIAELTTTETEKIKDGRPKRNGKKG